MLGPGSRIAVVAPGGAVASERLQAGIACLADWGWRPVLAPHLFDRHRYLAGALPDRAADLAWALTAPDIDAVWFARGGYGAAQLLATIPWPQVRSRPVIGFSDATALQWAMARRGLPSVHGPVLTMLMEGDAAVDDDSRVAIRRLLALGESTPLTGQHLCGPEGPVRGRLVGGNLTVLASLAGTREQFQAENAILFLEDVGEKPYRIERLLCQLVDSGGLRGVRGVALGEFIDCEASSGPSFLRDIWLDHLAPLHVPVIEHVPIGHGKRNMAVGYGTEVELHATGLRWS
jgi:muramoyltetrapeptide carboxypeptidase